MATGAVKWFNGDKGYGFITPDKGGKDVFLHVSAVEQAGLRSVPDGMRVSYEVKVERGKEAATDLQAI